ncbi:NlpC/P60 family protein [Nocardia sp. NPDC005978]|uniref:C40 family peptidase n=1 Tax=Nocardia sp. NPDC005978 TaxID=3156725 RepID=UPI0033B55FE6
MMDYAEQADYALRALRGLYGTAGPRGLEISAPRTKIDPLPEGGSKAFGIAAYGEMVRSHTHALDTTASRDEDVRTVTRTVGDGTIVGRVALDNHVADFRSRVQAIAAIADTRLSVPALLDSANRLLSSAGSQVNSDAIAAQRQAAQISASPSPVRRRRIPRRSRVARVVPAGQRDRPNSAVRGPQRRRGTTGDSVGARAENAAAAWLGTPYVWGGGGAQGPSGGGFDCSGLTQYAIAQATNGEVVLPRTTYDQINSGVRVHPGDARPGDLVFPRDPWGSRGPEHVQLAVEGGVIEAPYTGARVRRMPMPADAVVVRVL